MRNSETSLSERMAKLSERLAAETVKTDSQTNAAKGDDAGMGQGFRAAADLSGGVIVGVILGLGLDHFAGSSPWGLIVFVLLGFCAGVMNMLRSFGLFQPRGLKGPDKN